MPEHKVVKITLAAVTIMTLLGLCVSAPMAAPPANDGFSSATVINPDALPFSNTVDITEATTESGEPFACSFSYQTIWYRITPATEGWLGVSAQHSLYGSSVLSVYRDTGSGISGLTFLGCSYYSNPLPFLARAGTTYYLQALAPCCGVSGNLRVDVQQVPPPKPVANFYFYPSDPSAFETLQFYDNSSDPGQVGIESWDWNLGDGATATGCCPTHGYAADGDYVVQLAVTTVDGRTADTSKVVFVRTHDVAITKFRVPQSATAGQTRQISVGIKNTRYPETVRVQFEKSVPGGYGGFQSIGYQDQYVPVRPSNRTTDVGINYTFSSDDARIGKVTFRAIASILSGRDAFSGDNQAISSPVKVSRPGGAPVDSGGAPVVSGAEVASGEGRATVSVARLALLGVTPNPANAGVDLLVRLALPADGTATLQVLDVAGRVMAKRELGSLGPGIHDARVVWERRPAPGIYWVRLTHGGKSVSSRVGILQ